MSDATAERLLAGLGFSSYEARAYVGLLRGGPQTGYALANATGVPQPKVYEALRRLVDRGAAVRVDERPARYAPLPPDRLLGALEEAFRGRLESARTALEELPADAESWHEPVERASGLPAALERVRTLLEAADQKVLLAGWRSELAELAGPIADAVARGVELVVLHFGGDLPFHLPRGQTYRHASSEGALYRSHRARHLAAVADSTEVVWALAPGGDDWSVLASTDPLIVAALKDFVRHDIYVQKIFARLAPELHALFGPGLEFLTNLAADEVLGAPSSSAVEQAGA